MCPPSTSPSNPPNVLPENPKTPTLSLLSDTGVSSTDNITSNGTVVIGNLQHNERWPFSWQYSSDNGATWITGTGTSLTATGTGVQNYLVRQTNGFSTSPPSTITFTLVAPTAPTLSLLSATDIDPSQNITTKGIVLVSGLEAGTTWQYSTDDGLSWATGTGNTFATPGNGVKSCLVRQTSNAGNTSVNSSLLSFTVESTDNLIVDPSGTNLLTGTSGNDRFLTSLNKETNLFDGGGGVDTVDYGLTQSTDGNGIWADLSVGMAWRGRFDTLRNIENLTGSNGMDVLIGDLKSNILEGGRGKDDLNAGGGNDTYLFNRGDGVDTIHDDYQVGTTTSTRVGVNQGKSGYGDTRSTTSYAQANGGNDTLKFGGGISMSDLDFEKSGADVIIGLRQAGSTSASQDQDHIILKNWDNVNMRIENIAFADGSNLLVSDILSHVNLQTSLDALFKTAALDMISPMPPVL